MTMARTVGQPRPAALHRIRTGSGRSPAMSRSTTLIGTLASVASPTTISSYLPSLQNAASVASFRPLGPVKAQDQALRGAVVAGADARADLFRNSFSSTRQISALTSAGADASRRACTTAVALVSNSRNIGSGMSGRRPTFSARMPSPWARLTRLTKPFAEIRAPDCRRPHAPPRDRRAAPAHR